MKDIETAIQEETRSQKKSPAAVTHLLLDNKFKSASVKGLTDFVNLEVLSVSGCGLSSLEGFPSLPKLARLALSDNRIGSGLEHLGSLTTLTKLDLSGNRISSLEEFAKLKGLKIKSLDILGCPVENTPDFKDKLFDMLSELEYLDGADKNGLECDADEEDEDEEVDGDEDQYEEDGGAEDDDEDEEDEDEDDDEDEVEIDEDELEDGGGDEDDKEGDGEPGSDKKRKRAPDDNAGPDEEGDDEEEEEEEED